MGISDSVIVAANRRGAELKAAFPTVVSVRYDRRVARVVIELDSGLELTFAPKHAQGLENAHPADLVGAVISPR